MAVLGEVSRAAGTGGNVPLELVEELEGRPTQHAEGGVVNGDPIRSPGTIWNRPDRVSRGPHPEHSRAQFAGAAVRLADAGGLSAVSMRAVAGALETTAGSLYLPSRDEQLEMMVDAVLAELRLDHDSTGEWLDDLMALADDQWSAADRPGQLDRHPRLRCESDGTAMRTICDGQVLMVHLLPVGEPPARRRRTERWPTA